MKYYYQQMNKTEQSVYDAMYAGITALAPSIRILKLDSQTLLNIFLKLKLDNPLIFYAVNFSYRFMPGAEHVEFLPEYLFQPSKIREHQKALDARIAKLIRPALSMSDLEKERYIHEFICSNVRYDKLKKNYSHEIIGPLTHGIGVCEGIAKTVKLFCDKLGIECVIAISESAPERGYRYRHAWNVLKINRRFYHLDATFDLSLGRYGTARYDYFNLDDKKMFRDHLPLLFPVPTCTDGDNFYYRTEKRSYTKLEEVESRVLQALRKKQTDMVFHWRGSYLTRDMLRQLSDCIFAAAQTRGKYVLISVNVPQAILKLTFTDEPAESEIETETADESDASELQ